MSVLRRVTESLEQQQGLDGPSAAFQRTVAAAFRVAGRALQDALHGTWLGHPLHPVLTDIPIGAWACALVLDILELAGDTRVRFGVDLAIVIGLIGAFGAAVTGLADWQHTEGKPRRVGIVHGTVNLIVIILYGASLGLRGGDQRTIGQAVSFLGFGLLAVAGYLGGHLAYGQRIGMNQAAPMPEDQPLKDFSPVLRAAQLQDGHMTRVADAADNVAVLVRRGERVYALADSCTHLGCSLAKGRLQGASIVCACHGSRFALDDGRVLGGPATFPQPRYETRIKDGTIYLGPPIG